MVNSIVNEIITIPRWFNCPSWHCGDNLITLEGLLQNLTRELGAFERVIFFHWIDSSVLALMSTSMSLPICWLDACLRNFASRLKVVPVSTWTKLKVSLALVSIITSSAVEKFKSSSSGFILAQRTRSPILKLCGSACFLLSWYAFEHVCYKLHFDQCSRSSADNAVLFEVCDWTKAY